jgi:hypothetical protein
MPIYYAFKVTLGRQRVTSDTALIVTDDRTGEKLPKPRSGCCKFLRAITLISKSGDKVIVSHDDRWRPSHGKGSIKYRHDTPDLEIRHLP